MKRPVTELLYAIFLGAVIPAIFFKIAQQKLLPQQQTECPVSLETETHADATHDIPILLADGTVQMMDIDTYITAVVLAEMPADFEMEALKAQAVVARTYALKRVSTGNKHSQGAVCTDSSCCQAFCDNAELSQSSAVIEKIRDAVSQTSDQVLTYGGVLIEATYFSCSGGRTEDAIAVWGEEIPYLRSVESPGEEKAAHYVDTVSFTAESFCEKIGRVPTGEPDEWIGEITYTTGGGVNTIFIGGEQYSGVQLRSLLGLRSTAFVLTAVGDTITVTTKGYGHRVGMSQYGADAMAIKGCTYKEILAHYYPDTLLQTWSYN